MLKIANSKLGCQYISLKMLNDNSLQKGHRCNIQKIIMKNLSYSLGMSMATQLMQTGLENVDVEAFV